VPAASFTVKVIATRLDIADGLATPGVISTAKLEGSMASGIVVMTVLLAVSFSIPSSGFASEQHRNAVRRDSQIELRSAHRHRKPSAPPIAADRRFDDKPYAGHRTDIAGNSYFYYRVGADTPFGASRVLPPPYPR
jgi:hypothetical protein